MGLKIRVLFVENLQADDRVLWLVGAPSLPLTILSVVRCLHYNDKSSEPEFGIESDALRVLVPKGLEIVGAIFVSEGKAAEVSKRAGEFALKMRNSLSQSAPVTKEVSVVAASVLDRSATIEYNLYSPGGAPRLEALEPVRDFEDFRSTLWTNLTLLRCQLELTIPLHLQPSASVSDFKKQLMDAVDNIMGDLKSRGVVLLAKGSTAKSKKQGVVLIQPFNQLNANKTTQMLTGDLTKDPIHQSSICSDLSLPPSFFSTTSGMQLPEPVELTVMLQQCGLTNGKVSAPVVHYLPGSHVSLVDAATDLVLPALCDQLAAMSREATKNAAHNAKVDLVKMFAYQFCPPGWLHPVTATYDLSNGELELGIVERRKELHQMLGLPMDRPMLRVANAGLPSPVEGLLAHDKLYIAVGTDGRRLMDVHVGLPPSGIPRGRQSLIDGSYEYYHYLQDRIDDNGWGCAYRSLQTIVSWFRLQQYTTVPVPSHKEVQQTLVDIGDKEPSFVASKEWIGAIELSFVLDKLLGVSCKILNVRSGADMPNYCRELALHFQTQGTPVMIGGGVLAYTLLGVDYNELTGESAFLILDPHHTGADDLKTIRNGGWCGWKRAVSESGRPFFLHNKFYNLLLPQRPNTI